MSYLSFISRIVKRHKTGIFSTLLVAFFAGVAFINFERLGSFGCSDQCINIAAAYFMEKGKVLYRDIFFNHNMLGAYISYLIQIVLNPDSLYKLIVFHQGFVFIFSILFDVILFLRFRLKALGFVIFYELLKYYLHGNLFIPEALIVGPTVYLFLLVLEGIEGEKLRLLDAVFAGILAWFVIFMREPYVPVGIVLFGIVVLLLRGRNRYISLAVFSVLSFLILVTSSISDFIFQVGSMNTKLVVSRSAGDFLKSVFYPIEIFFWGEWNHFRIIEILLSSIFWIGAFSSIVSGKYKQLAIIFLVLTLASIRLEPPGTIFFEGFHMLVWLGLFLGSIGVFIADQKYSRITFMMYFIAVLTLGITIFYPGSYLHDKVNKQENFAVGFTKYYVYGEVIRRLSHSGDTLFLDRWDDIIYWQSGLDSSYKYSLYIPIMVGTVIYDQKRLEMFRTHPPTFYYASCQKGDIGSATLPVFVNSEYSQLVYNGNPSCLYVYKSKELSKYEKSTILELGFSLNEDK